MLAGMRFTGRLASGAGTRDLSETTALGYPACVCLAEPYLVLVLGSSLFLPAKMSSLNFIQISIIIPLII